MENRMWFMEILSNMDLQEHATYSVETGHTWILKHDLNSFDINAPNLACPHGGPLAVVSQPEQWCCPVTIVTACGPDPEMTATESVILVVKL